MGEQLVTREKVPYYDSSYEVNTRNGTAILNYRFPKGTPKVPYPLHIFGSGFASPAQPDGSCYFDPFMTALADLHESSAMVAITWPGMTRAQVKRDKNIIGADYRVGSQFMALPNIFDHVNLHTPSGISSVYFHGHSMGSRVMLDAFSKQFENYTSITEKWLTESLGLSVADACLVLHQPAFKINPEFSDRTEWKVMVDAIKLAKRVAPWSITAFGDAAIEITFEKLLREGKIFNNGFYHDQLYRKVLHPETTRQHLMELIDQYNGFDTVDAVTKSGVPVHLITTEHDKLTDNNFIPQASYASYSQLPESATHTAHLNPGSFPLYMGIMKNIIRNHEGRKK